MKNFNILGVHRKFVGCSGVGECPKKSNIEWVIVYKGGSGFGYFEDVRGGGVGKKEGVVFLRGVLIPMAQYGLPSKKVIFLLKSL